jgi:ABC-2 type transport system ATP-binding protein
MRGILPGARFRPRSKTISTPAIQAEGLTKRYGRHRGIAGVDLEVEAGEVFGFLGPNGAGKTTTIRLLLDLIRPSGGTVRVLGLDPRRDGVALRRRMGYLPGDLRLYERLTARELLTYFARLRGLPGLGDAPGLVDRLELELDRPISGLSKGNRQKVGLVQALMHRPELLVLDEPTAGLDPLVQQVFHELVAEVRADGRTTFLSSHVLPEIQHVADRVGLIRDGRVALVSPVAVLRARGLVRVEATFASLPPAQAFSGLAGVRELERNGTTIRFALDGEVDPLVKELAHHHVIALESREADLEDVFLSLFQGPDAE